MAVPSTHVNSTDVPSLKLCPPMCHRPRRALSERFHPLAEIKGCDQAATMSAMAIERFADHMRDELNVKKVSLMICTNRS